jgi:hypothetical protein
MRAIVQISLPEVSPAAEPAAKWWESFTSWLEVAPEGVTIQINRVKDAVPDEWVDIEDIKAYFRFSLPAKRVPYNARMVLFWLIQRYNAHLDVRCVHCHQRYLTCTCPESGYWQDDVNPDECGYNGFDPNSSEYEDAWTISRRSLEELSLRQVKATKDRSYVRLQRVVQFLQHLKEE